MRTHMHLQVGISGEWPGAYLAYKWFDTVMGAQMRYQRCRLREALAADFTKESLRAVGLLALLESAIMLRQMIVELFFLDEALAAAGALIWLDHIVLGHMDLQMFPPIEFLWAYVTQVLLALVYLNVPQ
jgi:hypothetical protein